MKCSCQTTLISLFFFLSVAEFSFGVFEAIIFAKYVDVKFTPECNYIMHMRIEAYITDILGGFTWFIYLLFALSSNSNVEGIVDFTLKLHSPKIIYDIISGLVYSTDVECYFQIIQKAPEVWISILTHYICGLFIIWLFVLSLIVVGIVHIWVKCTEDTVNEYEEVEITGI
jgi:hypothetical protein